ncbi:unnamed protein product [Moneuplotes crassus]|uniref:Ion transport domain-containing protein n=2 Tax=Euplotes crassus TaxID=5936 RepID=A0AAD1Y1E1_EUPCR|nr:unnamed protein product [Moneuplotes crassus]
MEGDSREESKEAERFNTRDDMFIREAIDEIEELSRDDQSNNAEYRIDIEDLSALQSNKSGSLKSVQKKLSSLRMSKKFSKDTELEKNTQSLLDSLGLGHHYFSSKSSMMSSNSGNSLTRRRNRGLKKKDTSLIVPTASEDNVMRKNKFALTHRSKNSSISNFETVRFRPNQEGSKESKRSSLCVIQEASKIRKMFSRRFGDSPQKSLKKRPRAQSPVKLAIPGMNIASPDKDFTLPMKKTSKLLRIGTIMNKTKVEASMSSLSRRSSLSDCSSQVSGAENDTKMQSKPVESFMKTFRNEEKKEKSLQALSKVIPRLQSRRLKKTTFNTVSSGNNAVKKIINKEGDNIFKEKLKFLNTKNCYQTASKYFNLAYRNVTFYHFHDDTFAQKAYFLTTSPFVRGIKVFLCWFYMFLTFFEPNNSTDTSIARGSIQFNCILACEIIILLYFLIDMILRIQFTVIAGQRIGFRKVFTEEMFVINLICECMMIVDAVLFYSLYPNKYFRFGRIFRAIKAVLESREVYRTTVSALNCYPQIIDLGCLISLISFLYAVFGQRFLDHKISGITRESNFSNLFEGTQNIYFLATLSNYPSVLIPYVKDSNMSLIFFYPFLVLTVLIILPLPVAIVFEAFKINRGKVLLKDRLHEKEGLLMCFMCIDVQRKGYISLEQWEAFFNVVYGGRQDHKKVRRVFESLDTRDIGYMNLEKFFQGCELIKSMSNLASTPVRFQALEKARLCLIKYTFLDKIVKSKWFDIVMFIVIILNMVLLLLQLCPFSGEVLEIFDLIDDIFVYIFCAEAVVKITGLGVSEYFNDNWNRLDFVMVILSLILSVTMSVIRISKNLVSSRGIKFLRFSKNQRCLKLVKWMKKSKTMFWLFATLDTLSRSKAIIIKAVLCLSSFRRITSVMLIVFYIYAVIGTELLKYSESEYEKLKIENEDVSYYEGSIYGNFQTFEDSIFALFQILTESSWHMIVLYQEIFHGFTLPCIFLLPFHLFITFILRSILLGLTWEVFAIVNEEEDYLMKSIKIDKDFKIDLEDNEFPNEKITMAERLIQSSKISQTNLTTLMSSTIEKKRHISDFDKLYKSIFESSNDDFKSLHRFIKRNIMNTCLRPEDFKEVTKLDKLRPNKPARDDFSLDSPYFNTHRRDITGKLFQIKRESSGNSTHSCASFRKTPKVITFDTRITLLGHEFESDNSSNCSFSESSHQNDERFGFYDEENLQGLEQEKKKEDTKESEIFNSYLKRDGKKKMYLRRVSSMYLAEEVMKAFKDDEEQENIELNGDYILKRALLKDHDVQALRTKEMQHVLTHCCRVHLGRDEDGKKIIQVYRKPEVKEVTEEEINSIVINFMRTLRISKSPKAVLDAVDSIQQKIEKICPFGSMIKIFYQYKNNDTWIIPHREEVETGVVKVENFMKFFNIATQGVRPILIQDVFTTNYQKEVPCFIRINGKKIKGSDNLSEIWYDAMNMLSFSTGSNLDKLPPELYEWSLFAIPLKSISKDLMNKNQFDMTHDKNDQNLELSISSIDSFDEEKQMDIKSAMILLFLCKKRKRSKQKKYLDMATGKYKFSFQWRETEIDKRIKTETLIKLLHDIRDIFNSHNDKVYYHMNDFIQFNELSHFFAQRMENPKIKRLMSV